MADDGINFASFRPARQDKNQQYQNLETPNVSVVPMNNRYATQNQTDSHRLQKFMGQIGGGNNVPSQNVTSNNKEDEYSENASGRFVGNRVVVDNVNDKFSRQDLIHISKGIPPGASAPTLSEIGNAWTYANDVRELQDEFNSDPLIQFFNCVEGFLNRGSNKKGDKQSMKVTDLYSTLAMDTINNRTGRSTSRGGIVNTNAFNRPIGNLQTFRVNVANNTHMPNTTTIPSPIDVQRTLDDSDRQDVFADLMRARRNGNTQNATNVSEIFTPRRTFQGQHNNQFNTPPSTIPNRINSQTPHLGVQLFTDEDDDESTSQARSFSNYYEPSGPHSTPTQNIRQTITAPNDLDDTQVLAPQQPQQQQNVNNNNARPQQPQQQQQTQPQNNTILDLAAVQEYKKSVDKYLSNVRTLDAYKYMSRPEITGDITISNTVLSCTKFAYKRLIKKYSINFTGATLLDFATKSISEEFAYYVHFWCLDVKITSMDVVPLNSAEARNLDKRYAYEEEMGTYYWDPLKKDFSIQSKRYSPYPSRSDLLNSKMNHGDAIYMY